MTELHNERPKFETRMAVMDDLERLTGLMKRSIDGLQQDFLSPKQIEASHEVMGLDSQLVIDGTYFVIIHEGDIVGSGGWSYRETLFGGDHSAGRDARLLDPKTQAGRIRAMYTDPTMARRGVGRLVMHLCEEALRAHGFAQAELAATLSGVPLYKKCGYIAVRTFEAATKAGVTIPLVQMQKTF